VSARRRWLVAYDIRDDVRLRRVHDIVRSYGERLQYSVFLCDVSAMERMALKSDLRGVINQHQDSIVFIDLGEPDRPAAATMDFMGVAPSLPVTGPAII
jgi:CRISPR-associated protein Cas2